MLDNGYCGNMEFDYGDNMKLKRILIIVALIASICFLTYPVSAESGSIVISDDKILNYVHTHVSASENNEFTDIIFDVANYNYLSSFHIHLASATFAHEFESTPFTITSGGIGSGYAWYDRNYSSIYWAFSGDSIITASHIIINYTKNIMVNVTGEQMTALLTYPDGPTQPVRIKHNQYRISASYYSVTVGLRGTDYYNVSYLPNNLFTVSIIKNPYADSKYFITGYNTEYSHETTFNKVNIVDAVFTYADGIVLNATLASGVYTKVSVNTTGYTVPDDGLPVVDPITGVGIRVTPTTGYLGTVFNISWLRTKPTPFGYIDSIEIFESGKTKAVHTLLSPPDSGYSKNTFTVASYTVQFKRTLFLVSTELLAYASFEVKPEQPSYLIINSTVLTKTNTPITYFIGTNLIGYVTGNKSLMMLEIREYDGINFINPRYYNILNQSGTINHIFPLPKKYKVSLFDYLSGVQLYEKIVTAIYSPDDIVLEKIKTSYITSDKSVYYYGEMITGTYGIDDTNFSQYNIIVSLLNESNGDTYCTYTAGENFDFKKGTFLYEFVQQSGNYFMGCEKGAGAANITLYRNNNSILEKLTSVSFNISNTNTGGYGLKISNLGCQKFSIVALSPTVAKLEIVDYNGKVERYFNFSETLNIIYSAKTKAQYVFNLYDSTGTLQISKIMAGSSDCIVIEDVTTYGGNVTATCGFWDNCVTGMFPGQGLNNVTRLLFALFCIVVMMFFGMVVSKGNFGVSVILGFLPYAFFTYLTLSSPCGEYMPVWISIFVALIVGIKMRWFS